MGRVAVRRAMRLRTGWLRRTMLLHGILFFYCGVRFHAPVFAAVQFAQQLTA